MFNSRRCPLRSEVVLSAHLHIIYIFLVYTAYSRVVCVLFVRKIHARNFYSIKSVMRINANVKLIGTRVILIPYEKKHVDKYHKWMSDKELQELTASEPLSLDEEYKMQKSWRIDDDKCTFLIIDREMYESTSDEIESLVGDTNLFLDNESNSAETEIMIAESNARRKKFGWEAMLMMLKFGRDSLKRENFVAKIGFANDKSQRMFEKMQFKETSRSEVFQEITYERNCSKDWLDWLNRNVQYAITTYH